MIRPPERLSRTEFVALMAMLFATIAFSIDSMLPALPTIADELSPDSPNHVQLVITSFVLGMGLGTLVTGPLSDAFGRRPVLLAGAAIYVVGAILAWATRSLELLLAARVLQGLGAAGPRVVAMAIVRDLYAGRPMAQILSFVMLIFSLVPALAPALGALLIAAAGWRAIFLSFVVFALAGSLWLILRQRETLPRADRTPFRLSTLAAGLRETLSHGSVCAAIVIQTLVYGMLFSLLSSIQPVMEQVFDRAAQFPLWFALIAVIAATGSIVNARIVMRFGMRRVATAALVVQIILSAVMVVVAWGPVVNGPFGFAAFVIWASYVFMMTGLTIGNLNALAMMPLGHIAGLAASVVSSLATVGAVLIAIPVSLAFDGTPLPLAIGVLVCAVAAYALTPKLGEPAPQGA